MLRRRDVMNGLATTGTVLSAPLLARAGTATAPAEIAARARIAHTVRDYDAQGIHRTATSVDDASARWLAGELRAIGLDAALEPFSISRIDLGDTYVELGGRQVGGVPLFDASFTPAEGISGRLRVAGSDGDIGLIEASPLDGTEHDGKLRRALDGRWKALVIVTNGGRAGLSLINAARFLSPAGVPALQVSSVETAWLREQAALGVIARVVATAERHAADALNVVATLRGTNPAAAPLVVMTPRSGWWTCAGERAGGIGVWLEVARAVRAAKPARDVHFLASSGHERGQIGLDAYLAHRPDLARRAALWVHFGANIGASPHIRLQSADLAIQQTAVQALAAQGLTPAELVPPGTPPGGEAGTIFRLHGRYVSLQGDNSLFHNPADRWPEAVDALLAARQGLAFAAMVANLAATA
jgi:hypothetical protein